MAVYPLTSKENSQRIRVAIRRVYLEVWDPIGIKEEPNAQNEYDSYLGGMLELLITNASDAKLKEYLDQVVSRMGMNSSNHSDSDVIAALRAIDLGDSLN
jgi:hypothetical protein